MRVSGTRRASGTGPQPSRSGWLNEMRPHMGRPSRSLVFGCGAGPPGALARDPSPSWEPAGGGESTGSAVQGRTSRPGLQMRLGLQPAHEKGSQVTSESANRKKAAGCASRRKAGPGFAPLRPGPGPGLLRAKTQDGMGILDTQRDCQPACPRTS